VWPFVWAQREFGFTRSPGEVSYWSASLASLLPTEHSWLYKPLYLGVFNLESSTGRTLYPGVIPLALALLGLILPLRRATMGARWFFAVLSLAGLVLSFGPVLHLGKYGNAPTGIALPYGWLYEHVPGFDALRVPARFGLLFMLGLAVCAGYGLASCETRVARRELSKPREWHSLLASRYSLLVRVGAMALVALEYWAPGQPALYTPTGKAAPALYSWLAGPQAARAIPHDALLLELPMDAGGSPANASPIYLMYGLAHDRPMLNGSANIIPPGYDRLFFEMRRFPSQGTLDTAEGLGVQYIIVHTGGLFSDEKRAALEQEAGPQGRLEEIAGFPDPMYGPPSRAVVYRLTPRSANARQRFAALDRTIPPGSDVLLADHPARHRLYTTVLPTLIGPGRHYFITYSTIYTGLMGDTQPAQPNRVYPYAIFYRDTDPMPATYGYKPEDRVDLCDNELIEVYHKR